MGWQEKGRKAAMGKFVRAKQERMVLITFDGEPTEKVGKNFNGEEVDELHFPVKFFDERSVGQRYEAGEAARICNIQNGEDKIFPVSSPPLLRELLAEDEQEAIIGRTFILSHTGAGKETVYKMREIKVTKQAALPRAQPKVDPEETFNYDKQDIPEEEGPAVGPNPKKDIPKKPTRTRKKKEKEVPTSEGEAESSLSPTQEIAAEDVRPIPTEEELEMLIENYLIDRETAIPWQVGRITGAESIMTVKRIMYDLRWEQTAEIDPGSKMNIWRPKTPPGARQ